MPQIKRVWDPAQRDHGSSDHPLRWLKSQLDILTHKNGKLTRSFDRLTQEKDALTQQNNILTEQQNLLTSQLNTITQEKNTLTQTLNSSTQENEFLHTQLTLASNMNQELKNSTSWKITSPIRYVKKKILRGRS